MKEPRLDDKLLSLVLRRKEYPLQALVPVRKHSLIDRMWHFIRGFF